MVRVTKALRRLLAWFTRNQTGSIAVNFSLMAVPLLFVAGAGVDYGHASQARTELQAALDAAVLAGANDGSPQWTTTAGRAFSAATKSVEGAAAIFSSPAPGTYAATATASVPTAF